MKRDINHGQLKAKQLKELREKKKTICALNELKQFCEYEFFLLPQLLIKVQSAVLPNLNNWVVVLLKMLLATVSVNNLTQPAPPASSGLFPPGIGEVNID